MRVDRYHGLYGDRRDHRVWKALGFSAVLHAALFLAFGRFHIRPVDRTFYAPIQVVNLVPPSGRPKPEGVAGKPHRASPPAPKVKPKAKSKPKAKAASRPPKPKPKAPPPRPTAIRPKPAPDRAAPTQGSAAPTPAPEPSPEALERKVAERIAALRAKHAKPPGPGPASAGDRSDLGARRVGQAIEAIRRRIDQASAGGPGGSGAAGISGSRSAIEEVRLRAYYNRLWERVKNHWSIPPGLKGRDLSVIVSVVLDRQGRILRRLVEEPSGSEAFDTAALMALERAQPLPPFPDEVRDETLEVGFRFHGE